MKIKGVDISDSKGLQDALADGEWAKPRFGGMWQGLIYAVIASSAYLMYQAGGDNLTLTVPWALCGVMFYVLVKYDSTLVHLWNYYEKDRIVSEYIASNLEEIMSDSQDIDSINDLDGTFEDK